MPDEIPLYISIINLLILAFLTIFTWSYARSTYKLVKQPIDFHLINEIYDPLNTVMISINGLINKYEEANLPSIRNIKNKIWYHSVNKSMSKSIEEWKDWVEKYEEIRRHLLKEVQSKVEEEIEKRMKDVDVDEPEEFRKKIKNIFRRFWEDHFPRLAQGQVEDQDYSFISSLNDPNEAKIAKGFPKTIYEKIEKQVTNIREAVRNVNASYSSLEKTLKKEMSKTR